MAALDSIGEFPFPTWACTDCALPLGAALHPWLIVSPMFALNHRCHRLDRFFIVTSPAPRERFF